MNRDIVDRSQEYDHDDAEIVVILSCGYRERFWVIGLSDDEYIRRTKKLKELTLKQ